MTIEKAQATETPDSAASALSTGLGAVVDAEKLVALMLDQGWHGGCEVINGYMPLFPSKNTRPKCVVRYKPFDCFLRHNNGPRQGFFWDIYGDDMQTVELAVLAIASAPAPRDCGPITFTIPLAVTTKKGKEMMGPSAIGAQPPPEDYDEEWLMMQEDDEGDEPFCNCTTDHSIEEMDWNQCDSCGKDIEP